MQLIFWDIINTTFNDFHLVAVQCEFQPHMLVRRMMDQAGIGW